MSRTTWESKVFPPDMSPEDIQEDPFSLAMVSKQVDHMAAEKDGCLTLDIAYSVDKV